LVIRWGGVSSIGSCGTGLWRPAGGGPTRCARSRCSRCFEASLARVRRCRSTAAGSLLGSGYAPGTDRPAPRTPTGGGRWIQQRGPSWLRTPAAESAAASTARLADLPRLAHLPCLTFRHPSGPAVCPRDVRPGTRPASRRYG
jgi:hypothetical protein